jgi:glycosyltransferase involved in cell wall biosynthesis
MCGAGFPEPLTFSLRARRALRSRRRDFDVVHDNQGMGSGMLGIVADGWPLLTTLHHPITVDRRLDLASSPNPWRKITKWRWYGFVRMQIRVGRQLPRFITVSQSSRDDITTEMGIDPARVGLVPVGVDERHFRPRPEVAKVPGRIMTTASADAPIKGLVHLLEALAKVRTERPAELVVIGKAKAGSPVLATLRRLGIEDAVQFVSGVSDDEIVRLYAEAEVACVPSLYEGFSLPAIEAMACGVPVVATTGGALPEVVGTDGNTALLVAPADPGALATAIGQLLDDPARRASVAQAGRERVLERFTWQATAKATAEEYRRVLAEHGSRG